MNETWVRPSGGNGKAVLVGLLAMILGAGLWAVITLLTAHEFSFVAMGIGALVALAMNSARPTNLGIAVVAALLTVIGCALGRFFIALLTYAAHTRDSGFAEVPSLYVDTMSARTYLYWTVGALVSSTMLLRRIKATREVYVPSGAAPSPAVPASATPASAMPGTAQPPYAPGQEYPPR